MRRRESLISGCITSRGEYTDGESPPEAAAGDLRLESDSRNTSGIWKERLSGVRNCRFAFEAIPDLPEMTGALRKIDRIRKRGNPGCDAT